MQIMRTKKLIIFYGRFELPNGNALAHRALANAYILSKNGFKCILVGYSKELNKNYPLVIDSFLPNIELHIHKYPTSLIEWFFDTYFYKKILRIIKMHNDFETTVILNDVGLSNTNNLFKKSRGQFNIICDVVDCLDYSSGGFFYKNLKNLIEKKLTYSIRPKIKNIICISKYLKLKYDEMKCNTLLLPPLTFKDDKRFILETKYNPSKIVRYCYCGNPGKKCSKDRLDWCLIAFFEISKTKKIDLKFDIFGISKECFLIDFPELRYIAENDKICFHGKVDNKECLINIANSDFFLLARENNIMTRAGFPTKISESLALSTPVITTPTSDIGDYIIDGKNGLLAEDCSYQSFLKAVIRSVSLSSNSIIKMHKEMKNNNKLNTDEWQQKLLDYIEQTKRE